MSGWTLPPSAHYTAGSGPFNGESDSIDFIPGSKIPPHFIFNRYPSESSFVISPRGYQNKLQIKPSPTNLTGILDGSYPALSGQEGQSFICRLQEHTFFTFSVDLTFDPKSPGQEAGITAFLTQANHISISIASPESLPSQQYGPHLNSELRFSIETTGTVNSSIPSSTTVFPIPATWPRGPLRLQIHSANATDFVFSAFPAANLNAERITTTASAVVVSGGSGPFTGNLLGVFVTCNGVTGKGKECAKGGEAYFGRWKYQGAAQQVGFSEWGSFCLRDGHTLRPMIDVQLGDSVVRVQAHEVLTTSLQHLAHHKPARFDVAAFFESSCRPKSNPCSLFSLRVLDTMASWLEVSTSYAVVFRIPMAYSSSAERPCCEAMVSFCRE